MTQADIGSEGSRLAKHDWPISWFANNPIAANCLLLVLLVGGLLFGSQLEVQTNPEYVPRVIEINIAMPEASPRQVDQNVSRRVEDAVINLTGIERVASTSRDGHSRVQIETSAYSGPTDLLEEVISAVNGISRFPPQGAEEPKISVLRATSDPISMALVSSEAAVDGLRNVAEQVRDDLLMLPSVSRVEFVGARDRAFAIELNSESMARHGITVEDVVESVRRNTDSLTIGDLLIGSGDAAGRPASGKEITAEYLGIPIAVTSTGSTVRLGDISEIREDYREDESLVRVDGKPAILIAVPTSWHQSLPEIGEQVRALLDNYSVPPGFELQSWDDQASSGEHKLRVIVENGVIGIVLVFIGLLLVFDLRIAFWITAGIPLSFIGSMLLFNAGGSSLNTITLLAFFLMIGIVVDDAVVVGESIMASRTGGLSGIQASIAGARSVFGPVLVGSLTTIIALAPLYFLDEGVLQLFKAFPIVAACVLLVSTLDAFLILPSHLAHERRWSLPPLSQIQGWCDGKLEILRDRVVVTGVAWAVRNAWASVALAALVFIVGVLLVRFDAVRINLAYEDLTQTDKVQVDIRLPVGTPATVTSSIADRFADAAVRINELAEDNPVSVVTVVVGEQVSLRGNESSKEFGSHLASVRLDLSDGGRSADSADVKLALQDIVGNVPEATRIKYSNTAIQAPPSIGFAVFHANWDAAVAAGTELTTFLQGVPGVLAVSSNLDLGKRELNVELTPMAEAIGLTPAAIGAHLQSKVLGLPVQHIQSGDGGIKVLIRHPEEDRKVLERLGKERIAVPGLGSVQLQDAIRLVERRQFAAINRIDGRRAVLIEAYNDAGAVTERTVRDLVLSEYAPMLKTSYPGLEIELDGASRQNAKIVDRIMLLFPLALIAIYAVTAALLRSYWQPFVAVLGLPICLAGAVFAHFAFGWTFGLSSAFGVFAAFGVTINDALVLLDRYGKIRQANPKLAAIAALSGATRLRFRAVLLTTVTTILGVSPLLFESNIEILHLLVPFVISMLGALILSCMFMLFVLPALVMIVDGRLEGLQARQSR